MSDYLKNYFKALKELYAHFNSALCGTIFKNVK